MNLYNNIFKSTEISPAQIAITGPKEGAQFTYGELHNLIETCAKKLKNLGVQKGQTIALHCTSGVEYIIHTFALWKCEACVVPIAVELTKSEKAQILESICIEGVISSRKHHSTISISNIIEEKELNSESLFVQVQSQRTHPAGFEGLNPAFIRFSSGTTGKSKGVILSHESVYERIYAANDVLKISSSDNVVWLLSMSYHFTVSIVAYLNFGATIILCKNNFAKTIIDATVKHKGTLIYGSPVHYDYMFNDKSDSELTSLRLAISTAAYLRSDIAEGFYKRFKVPLSEAYGIIEMGLPCINVAQPLEKAGSVGPVLPDFEIKLEDVGLGKELQAIKVRGKGNLDAYYDPWTLREEILKDGWFATGDLGYLDEDQFLFIQGRSKEIINTGGMKFFPQEVESILESHADVVEALIYPFDNSLMGEEPHCSVVLAEGVDIKKIREELTQFCKENLATYKVPKSIEFVETLPKTASGKLIRHQSKIKR